MADPTSSSSLPSRPKSRRWLRWLGLSGLILVLLLVTVYFVATSGAFFKGFILPRVAQALHARVTVADAVIHPFSGVSLTDLKVETTGTEPLLSAREVRARYSLWDILRGQLNIAEVLVSQPTVVIVKNADGTSNLDPLTQGEGRGEAGKKSRKPDPSPGAGGAKAGRPPQIDLRSFRLENATVRTVTQMPGGGQTLAEVSKVTITLENLKNGQTGKFTLGSDFSYQLQPLAPQPAASVQGHVAAAFEVALGADLSLTSLRGNLQLGLPAATGSLAEAAGFTLGLDTELGADPASQTATLRAFSLKGARRETPLLLGTLTSPLRVSWGGGGGADTSDAAMSVVLTNVNLAEWKGFAPALDASGRAQATLLVTSKKSGQQIGFNLAAAVENLAARVGSNAVNSLQILVTAQGEANNGQQIELTAARFSGRKANT